MSSSVSRTIRVGAVGLGLSLAMGCAMNDKQIDHLSRQWILVWNEGDASSLPLAEDFVHVSPFGRLEGRKHYLKTVIPMSKKNAAKLAVEDVLVSGNQSVVRYNVVSPSGATMPACDWLTFEGGKLARVRSYYERPAEIRSDAY